MKVVLVKGLSYGLKGRLFMEGVAEDVSDEDGQYLLNETEGKFRKIVRGTEVLNEVDVAEQAAERENAREFKLSDLVSTPVVPADEAPVLDPAPEKKGGVKIVKTLKKAATPADATGDFDTAEGNPAADGVEEDDGSTEVAEDTEEKVDL